MSDNRGSVFVSDAPDSRLPMQSPKAPAAPVSAGEVFEAHTLLGFQRLPNAGRQEEIDAYLPIIAALDRDDKRSWLDRTFTPSRYRNYFDGVSIAKNPIDTEAVWDEIERRRTADPAFMKDIPAKSAAEFSAYVLQREQGKRRTAQEIVERQSGAAQAVTGFAADVATAFMDPVNIATLPIGGGGKTIWQSMGREALTNGLIETAQLPQTNASLSRFGEEMTPMEMLADVGAAAAGGALIPGALHAGGKAVGAVAGAVADSAVGRAAAKVVAPIALSRARLAEASDAEIAATFARTVPAEMRTPDEQAALHVIERQAEIDASNPFADTPAGRDAHAERLEAAIGNILRTIDPDVAIPAATARGTSPDVSRETPVVRGGAGAREQLKAKIGRVENATGNPNARNPNSSATGKYQFVDGTWLRYYKREIGAGGLSDAQILARRSDGATQDRLMDALLRDNAAGLHRIGEAETAGNLYLAHFAGIGGARKILKAAPDTPIERVLSPRAIEANGFLRGKTAADVVAWAHRKMAEAAVPAGERAVIAGLGDEGEDAVRLAQQAIDAATMERAMLSRDGEAVEPVAIDLADELAPWANDAVEAASIDLSAAAELERYVPGDTPAAIEVSSGSAAVSMRPNPVEAVADEATVAARDPRTPMELADERRAGLALARAAGTGGVGPARLLEIAAAHAPDMPRGEWLGDVLGTRKWVVAQRLTPALKARGYELAVPQDRYTPLRRVWEDANGWRDGRPPPTEMSAEGRTVAASADFARGAEAAATFADPMGTAAKMQSDGLSHDLRRAIDAGEIGDAPFAITGVEQGRGDAAPIYQSAKAVIDALDDDDAAIAALRACL